MGSGLKAQNMTGIRAQGSEEWDQGSDLLHGLKISYHNIFQLNKVCVHRISWPRYITYSCFRLAAVPVIRSPGCLTKTWYHILNLLIVEGTVIWISSHFSRFVTQLLNTLSTPEGTESDLCISFLARNGEEEKGQKGILWHRKVRKYFLDWFTSGKGPSIARVFGPINHNNTARTRDKQIHWKRNFPHHLKQVTRRL